MKKTDPQQKTILLVEDESDLRVAVRNIISTLNVNVLEAENGLEALKEIENKNLNVVITDIKMPQMDGIELAAALKKLKPDVPVIFFSGYADKELSIKAIRLGAFDMIEKPAKKEELLSAAKRALEKNDSFVTTKLQLLNLNTTQTKILELVLRGMGNKEIADAIRLSEQGVKYHVGGLFKRFETTNRFDLKNKILHLVGQKAG